MCNIGSITANLPRLLLVFFKKLLCSPQIQIKLPAGDLLGGFNPFIQWPLCNQDRAADLQLPLAQHKFGAASIFYQNWLPLVYFALFFPPYNPPETWVFELKFKLKSYYG